MAADEAGERTEPATPRRREEAREEGRIARSADLTAAVTLLAGLLSLNAGGPWLMEKLVSLTRSIEAPHDATAAGIAAASGTILRAAAVIIAPLLGSVWLAAVVATAVQSGVVLSWKRLTPSPEKLNPVVGLRRLVSADSAGRLAMGVVKTVIVTAVAYFSIRAQLNQVLGAGALGIVDALGVSAAAIFRFTLNVGVALLILAIVDYLLERWKLERNLRMTRQEVRDELRRMEGDPLIKQRRRQIQQRLAMQRLRLDVPKADVVVSNPTHFAVALRYDSVTMSAPRVIAKGQDFLAMRIRQIAQEHGIPIVQRAALARALYAAVDVGDEVPPTFYRAVAEVLAYVYQLSGRAAG
jgi:flagellar biosynthetic protein FlhB